mgnify:CR=1 FL=1
MEQNTKQIRELTKEIRIGDRVIGGSYPILIQSMTNTKTQDVDATVEQILRLEEAGCEIVRCTVPDMEAAKAIGEIKKRIHIPLVADIHFDYRLAMVLIRFALILEISEVMSVCVLLSRRQRNIMFLSVSVLIVVLLKKNILKNIME